MMLGSHLDTIFDTVMEKMGKCEWYNKVLIHI